MTLFKKIFLINCLVFINFAIAADVKKNRDNICGYNNNMAKAIKDAVGCFETSKDKAAAAEAKKVGPQQAALDKESVDVCALRSGLKKWEQKHLDSINGTLAKINKLGDQVLAFIQANKGIQGVQRCKEFLRSWPASKKADKAFK